LPILFANEFVLLILLHLIAIDANLDRKFQKKSMKNGPWLFEPMLFKLVIKIVSKNTGINPI